MEFNTLQGLVLKSISGGNPQDEEVVFTTDCGRKFRMFHYQDCCEGVYLESVVGDWADLLGSPILMAEESISNDAPKDFVEPRYADDSQTWSFYKLATIKGYVDLRWFGSSNGYYSETVSFEEIT